MASHDPRFKRLSIALTDLDLDPRNPRISLSRHVDENQCIERLAQSEGKALLALCRDIAENGLGLDPIVVELRGTDYIVRDGNRRTASLKMLSNPTSAPLSIRNKVQRIADNAAVAWPEKIECEVSEDLRAILKHIQRKHTGEGEGEGQKNWRAMERARFELEHDLRGQDDMAARIVRYAEDVAEFVFDASFPITTLTRFLTQERIRLIGFADIECNPATLSAPKGIVHARLARMVEDFSSGTVNVKRTAERVSGEYTMMSTADQAEYMDLLARIGMADQPDSSESANADSDQDRAEPRGDASPTGTDDSTKPGSTAGGSQETTPSPGAAARGRVKPAWDRKSVASPKATCSIAGISREHRKALDILVELQRIDSARFINAAYVLARIFIELTMEYYSKVDKELESRAKQVATSRRGQPNRAGVAHRMEAAATLLQEAGRIDKNTRDVVVQASNKEHLSLESLNQIVHAKDVTGDKQSLHTLWDNLLPFLRECWKP